MPPKAPKASPAPKPPSKEETAEALRGIIELVEQFCHEHLTDEYAGLCRKLAEKLGRKRPSPLLSGNPNTWACGMAWSLRSRMDQNPMAWMIQVNGFLVDARFLKREIQEEALRKGLISYIPERPQPFTGEEKEEKTAMAELGNPQCTDGERGRPKNGFFKTSSGVAVQGAWHSLPLYARRLAILVHQRKDPTLPYQALASRESVRLFLRVCPLGTLDVLATRIWCS